MPMIRPRQELKPHDPITLELLRGHRAGDQGQTNGAVNATVNVAEHLDIQGNFDGV